jgi:glycosyltransferase involved in cell wall biosynthesis
VVATVEAGPGGRAARLCRASMVLLGVGVLLVVGAVWSLVAHGTRGGSGTAVLPLDVELHWPSLAVFLAAAAITAATFVGIGALETAAAMQVLARERRPVPNVPAPIRRAGRWVLGARTVRAPDLEGLPAWQPTALPERTGPGIALRCTVLIPAHDEEAVLGATLESLRRQTRPPDRVVVVADNCTDGTAQVARAAGAEVVETVDNAEKKAGALNQQLQRMLPGAAQHDVVLVMDADSTINEEFLDVALRLLEDDPDLLAVGGLFYGEDGGGLVGQLQRNEFTRYQRLVARRLDRVFVLTGTASVMRVYALRAVAEARGSLVPGTSGQVYDTLALTEDNELTMALKTLGARLTSPRTCRVTTEIMPSWRDLWRQRLRWHRGALENIGAYGLTRATAAYWGQQLGLAYGVVALNSYLLLVTITLLAADSVRWSLFWSIIGVVFVVERLVTVWAVGWRGRALAAPLVIELGYVLFLQACFVTSITQIVTGRKAGWNYVPRPAVHGVALGAVVAAITVTSGAAYGIVLPTSVLRTDWYQALSLWVAFNTLVFATLGVVNKLPPRRRRSASPS